jgi:serine/threonine protein phosphatase PrpC
MTKRRFTYGQATEKSNIRERNEDAALSLMLSGAAGFGSEDIGLFIVVDGAGGKGVGEAVARLTVQKIALEIIEQLSGIASNYAPEPSTFSLILISAFQKANEVVAANNSREWAGIAAATAALIVNQQAYIAFVGDVKAYIVSQNDIQPVTIVHDFLHESIRRGLITWDDYNSGKVHVRNVLYRAFGYEETLEVDTTIRELHSSDTLVLCCDGIWARVEDSRIQEIIWGNPDPQEACEQLIANVNMNQSFDDMTAIVVKMCE